MEVVASGSSAEVPAVLVDGTNTPRAIIPDLVLSCDRKLLPEVGCPSELFCSTGEDGAVGSCAQTTLTGGAASMLAEGILEAVCALSSACKPACGGKTEGSTVEAESAASERWKALWRAKSVCTLCCGPCPWRTRSPSDLVCISLVSWGGTAGFSRLFSASFAAASELVLAVAMAFCSSVSKACLCAVSCCLVASRSASNCAISCSIFPA
mmetsp:Transcript_41578/g.120384  ORF Transcript_41578/g.120384 Transcript_41578/m.120384 type:complete len:210 (-) Transcript_41578:92-721(-)